MNVVHNFKVWSQFILGVGLHISCFELEHRFDSSPLSPEGLFIRVKTALKVFCGAAEADYDVNHQNPLLCERAEPVIFTEGA